MTRPPKFLIGAALLFWGWQSDFLLAGALMAVVMESAAFTRARWDLSEEDFGRIWTFCTLCVLASLVYAFTSGQGPSEFRSLFQDPTPLNQRNAGMATARTAASVIRWLPMLLFLFFAAQQFSTREGVPLALLTLIMGRRWKKLKKSDTPRPPSPAVNVGYAYFALCLFAASVHPAGDLGFFWGLCVLLTWALVAHRSRRFHFVVWGLALVAALGLGYLGQVGFSQLQGYFDNLNSTWFFRFSRGRFDARETRTFLGQIGRVQTSGRIVVRLEAPPETSPPALLREASYSTYRDYSWYSDLQSSSFGYVAETNNAWLLLPAKTNRTRVNIACSLPGGTGLLPLPEGSGRLEHLSAFVVQKNDFGAVLAQGPGLVVFDAFYGPGPTIDSAANPDQDQAVPPREVAALEQVIEEGQLKGKTRVETLRGVQRFFLEKFSYSIYQQRPRSSRTNETALTRFLLRSRSGHCEYFATATVLLLRQLGIPARYAVGYAVHERSSGRKFVVRQRDAHAWCLVWNPDRQVWEDFDTTPASWFETEGRRAAKLQFLSDFWSRVGFEFSKFRWGQTRLRQYILWALLPILALLLYQIITRARRHRRPASGPSLARRLDWPGLDSEFYQLERTMTARGLPREPGEPLTEWLQRATDDPGLADARAPLTRLLRLHYRYRFDPHGLAAEDRETLRNQVREFLERAGKVPEHHR